MVLRLEIAGREEQDPRGRQVAEQIRSFLGIEVGRVRTRDVYLIEADLHDDDPRRLLQEFVDPVLQRGAIGRLDDGPFDAAVTVGFKPGVTDPVGKSARVAVEDTLGRRLAQGSAVYTGRMFLLDGVDTAQAERIGTELLANAVIQTIRTESYEAWSSGSPDLEVPRVPGHETPAVQAIDLGGADDELERISREGMLALTLTEMRAIRDHFRGKALRQARQALGLGDRPTDVELECLAQTWSEHCSHKIFNATITHHEEGRSETIPSLFKQYIRKATADVDAAVQAGGESSWLVSVFHDNAGAVTFDDQMHLVYKVETHNSPSALDPYGGAMTGIVGVNRDPFGTGLGCELLANVWGYCFATPFYDGELPRGLMHPRRIRDGVHHGVIDGGNQSGLPYGRGWELFDDRYVGKPLVFCGTVGSMPVEVCGRPGETKEAFKGDRIVMTGGRIGADGIHGATFSSAVLDESAPVQAVQIGDPITQKRMFDFLLEARRAGLYRGITDNGAGGLSSSVGEMAEGPGGARLDLAQAPLKYAGLAPWEILVSEAQERMTLAVAPEKIDEFLALARKYEVEATDLGEFTDDGFFHVMYGDETVAYLSMEFLHDGAPDLDLTARWAAPSFEEPATAASGVSGNDALLAILGRLNLCSGETKARHYDHEVKGLTVVKPWIGVGRDVPAEATVFLARHGSMRGFVLSEGVNPFYSDIDTEAMAHSVVDLAVRRQLCAGARLDKIALLDNFCWPDPVQSAGTPDGEYKLSQLVRACRGLYDTCVAYRAPLISGKDSMKNDSAMGGTKISVPPTLLVSAIGQIDDVVDAVTLEPKRSGDVVFLVGPTRDETGGGEYLRWRGEAEGHARTIGLPGAFVGNRVPRLDTAETLPRYRALEAAIGEGLVRSAATPALGGWAVTFARCAIAAQAGLELDLDELPGDRLDPETLLYSESNGRFLITTSPENADAFATRMAGTDCVRVGTVTDQPRLIVRRDGERWIDLEVSAMKSAWRETLAHE